MNEKKLKEVSVSFGGVELVGYSDKTSVKVGVPEATHKILVDKDTWVEGYFLQEFDLATFVVLYKSQQEIFDKWLLPYKEYANDSRN